MITYDNIIFQEDSNTPEKVKEEIDFLWETQGMNNGDYFRWNNNYHAICYPEIDNYLIQYGIYRCLIYNTW